MILKVLILTLCNQLMVVIQLLILIYLLKESSDTIINETMCTGSNYNFNGQSLFDSGQYIDTLVSVNGCDSLLLFCHYLLLQQK